MSAQILRRNPLYRWHRDQGAEFSGQLVQSYTDQPVAQGNIGITDLTGLARIGFKGLDTPEWLSAQGVDLPEQANTAISSQGLVNARLSATEFLLLKINDVEGESVDALRNSWSMDISQRCYLLERSDSHACFAVTGPNCADFMAKVCAVDLRAHKFEQLRVAQTSVARCNAIVIRFDENLDHPQFLILADLSTAEFLWECLLDAMQEFAGSPLSFPAYLERIK